MYQATGGAIPEQLPVRTAPDPLANASRSWLFRVPVVFMLATEAEIFVDVL